MAHSFAINLFHKFIAGISGIIIARLLGPAGKGRFALITLVSSVALSLISVGLVNAQIHLKRKYSIEKVTVNSLFIAFLAGILFLVLFLLSLPFLRGSVFKDIELALLIVVVAFIPLQLCGLSLKRTAQSMYDIKAFNYLNTAKPVIFLVSLVTVTLLISRSLLWILLAWVFASVVSFVISFLYVNARLRLNRDLFDRRVLKDIVLYAMKVSVGGIFGFFQYRVDVFIVAYFLDAAAVGFYVVGLAVAEVLWRIPSAVVNVLLPKVADSADDKVNKITPMICRETSVLILGAGLLIFVLAHHLINLLYGSAYQPSVAVLRWVLPGVYFVSLWKILINDFNARGYPLFYGYSASVAVVVMVLLDIILIPRYGIVGAAVASSVAYFSSFITIIFIYRYKTGVPFRLFLPRTSDVKGLYFKNVALLRSLCRRAA